MSDAYQYPPLAQYRADRDHSLRKDYGWLALAGLHWLEPGRFSLGSDPQSDVRLPAAAPANAGELRLQPDQLVFAAVGSEAPSVLEPDVSGDPTFIEFGPVRLMAIRRQDRWGLRVWDNSRRDRQTFPGRAWFEPTSKFRVTAAFTAESGQHSLPTTYDEDAVETVAGWLTFSLGADTHKLLTFDRGGESLFVTFADSTNGSETYGGGRYLYLPPPQAGEVDLNFNYAYNPPCAYTHFATCALPPPINRLPLPIRAGERENEWHPSG